MSDRAYHDDYDLADALAGIRTAIAKITSIAGRGHQPILNELIGAEPKLREVYEQLREGHRVLHREDKEKGESL